MAVAVSVFVAVTTCHLGLMVRQEQAEEINVGAKSKSQAGRDLPSPRFSREGSERDSRRAFSVGAGEAAGGLPETKTVVVLEED